MLQAQSFRVVRDQRVKGTEQPAGEGEGRPLSAALGDMCARAVHPEREGQMRWQGPGGGSVAKVLSLTRDQSSDCT